MALYKYSTYLDASDSNAFDASYSPGDITPYSGIYRCDNCGKEIASNKGNPLPHQESHQHEIRWRLIVYAEGRADT